MPSPLLPLDDARWAELEQAYGPAQDVPRLLGALAALPDARERAEIWFGLWSTLCPPGAVFTASYAAAPHLLALAEGMALAERAQGVQLVATIEAHRHRAGAPAIPRDLVAAYAEAIERIPAVVCAAAAEPWDAETAWVMASALLVAKRHPRAGLSVLELAGGITCSRCGAPVEVGLE